MSEPFLGEIRMIAASFAPRGWAFCDGQLLAVAQYGALAQLLGTAYGGDGRVTFGLPDLRGRIPVHAGTGPGLTPRRRGDRWGDEKVGLSVDQLPGHTHALQASSGSAREAGPEGHLLASPAFDLYHQAAPRAVMAEASVAEVGESRPHDNMMPFLCVHFIISLTGLFPARA